MNPACRQNMESRECQEWMNLVSSHCRPLLPNAEQALLWDRWWPDDLTAPYKTWVSTMSAFDCHRLRKVVARQVAAQVEGGLPAEGHDHPVMWSVYRWIVVLVVLLTVVMAMAFAVRILIGSARGWRPAECTPTPPPTPRIVEAPPPPVDVEAPACKPFKEPRSFISFGQHSDPRTRYGPYKHQSLLETNSMPDCPPRKERKAPSPAPKKRSLRLKKKTGTK